EPRHPSACVSRCRGGRGLRRRHDRAADQRSAGVRPPAARRARRRHDAAAHLRAARGVRGLLEARAPVDGRRALRARERPGLQCADGARVATGRRARRAAGAAYGALARGRGGRGVALRPGDARARAGRRLGHRAARHGPRRALLLAVCGPPGAPRRARPRGAGTRLAQAAARPRDPDAAGRARRALHAAARDRRGQARVARAGARRRPVDPARTARRRPRRGGMRRGRRARRRL
ncbi:MAG: 6-phosphogluconolactonase, eukaryotic type, partial [uncultured Solirubrobacteraceae bacterium]